jgi:nucleotide-binding universal stress UspA family protein
VAEFPALIAEAETARGDEAGQLLPGECARLAAEHGVEPIALLRRGPVVNQILRCATEGSPDLVVDGTRGLRGAKRIVWDSVSQAVSRRAKAEVVLVRERGRPGGDASRAGRNLHSRGL